MPAFIHSTAVVLGNVILGTDSSVWPTAVIRGDVEQITIGARSNVQDGAVLHADPGVPTIVGEGCVIGHRAVVHGTVIEDGCLIGMGAILLNRVRVGAGSIVGAGALCPEGMQIPPGSLALGVPARVIRKLDQEAQAKIRENAMRYVQLARAHQAGMIPRIQQDTL